MSNYVLDTSALPAYIENEEGADEVETLFVNALDSTIEIFISTVTCIEVFYISLQEQGNVVAAQKKGHRQRKIFWRAEPGQNFPTYTPKAWVDSVERQRYYLYMEIKKKSTILSMRTDFFWFLFNALS